QMQVRAADRGRGDLDDRIGRLLDARVGDGLDRHLASSLPRECLHARPPPSVSSLALGTEWPLSAGHAPPLPGITSASGVSAGLFSVLSLLPLLPGYLLCSVMSAPSDRLSQRRAPEARNGVDTARR